MTLIRKYNPGEYCWADLGTKDVAGAKKFYRGLWGWKFADFPMGGNAIYSIARVDGKDVCAVYTMPEDQKKMKGPPFWLPYISVKSVDGSVKKVKSAGGKIAMKAMDVMDKGRMAIVQDPTGAGFALWEARSHKGAGIAGTPGTVSWHDLSTPNPAVAGRFYEKVIGWKTKSREYSGNAYHLFKLSRKDVCGMWPFPMEKLPPSWVTYWLASKCATAVAKVKRLGGSVLMGTTTVPDMVRFAIVKDPQGAVFGILEPI